MQNITQRIVYLIVFQAFLIQASSHLENTNWNIAKTKEYNAPKNIINTTNAIINNATVGISGEVNWYIFVN